MQLLLPVSGDTVMSDIKCNLRSICVDVILKSINFSLLTFSQMNTAFFIQKLFLRVTLITTGKNVNKVAVIVI